MITIANILVVFAHTNIFRKTFFPTPPEVDLVIIKGMKYDSQKKLPPITEKEIRDALRIASPLEAPSPDGIVNKAPQTRALQLPLI